MATRPRQQWALRFSVIIVAAALAAPARAAAPPQRTRVVTVFGRDACPPSAGDEIVVCAREPESERFRIPKRFREEVREKGPESRAWASHVQEMDMVTRFTRPNSCSPIGTGGQTGCTQLMIQQWLAERRATEAEKQAVP